MKTNFKIGEVVKYSNPQIGEEDLRFYVNEIHESDGNIPEKLCVELVCDEIIKPTFCYFSSKFESSWYSKEVEYMGKIVECECFGRL